MPVAREAMSGRPSKRWPTPTQHFGLVAAYVVVVLAVDTLSVLRCPWPFDWAAFFQWRFDTAWRLAALSPPAWTLTAAARSFDLYKFLCWLVIPLCFSAPHMDWSWFSIRAWKRRDWLVLLLLLVACGAAVAAVQFIPSLRAAYPGMRHLPWEHRVMNAITMLIWVLSWLPGWEFLHRYVLLRAAMRRFPRHGWLLVPLSETLYHLQKPLLEAAGMALFSLALTWWSMKRKNLLLPFAVHLAIEIMLIAALLFLL